MENTSLSQRGNEQAENPARIDFEIFMEAIQNIYTPIENPDGTFPLNVAENNLSAPLIKAQLTSLLQQKEIPDWALAYTSTMGHPEVRTVIAQFMEEYLCQCPIDSDHIGLSAGAAAIIEVSSFVLANPGDVVVIPAPAYPTYTNDLGIKSGMQRHDLPTHFDLHEVGSKAPLSIDLLEKAWMDLHAQGKGFKILLLTSPDNPTGCRYTAAQLRSFAEWCVQRKIHLIVNEIYGLSLMDTPDNDKETYVSFAKIIGEFQSDYLHLWYAFSKDFAMSGFRIGVVYSMNEAFLRGYANTNVPHMVSNLAQWALAELLKDSAFVDAYLTENTRRLNQSYQFMIQCLKQLKIPFLPSKGSFFVWADFSKYLQENTEEGEQQLWLDIYHKTGILLTPGIGFGHPKNGLFRIVFTAVPLSHLQVAMTRLSNFLKA